MVVVWLGLYFVSTKHSLVAHKVKLVVPNLAQECCVQHTDPYTIGRTQSHLRSHLLYLMSHVLHVASLSIIEVMCIKRAYYGVSYPSYQLSMVQQTQCTCRNISIWKT